MAAAETKSSRSRNKNPPALSTTPTSKQDEVSQTLQPLPYVPIIRDYQARKSIVTEAQVILYGAIPSVPPLEPIDGVPRGLESLFGMTSLFLRREALEWPQDDQTMRVFNNRFSILNQVGHRIFYVGEELKKSTPRCFRPFTLHFFDPGGKLVMEVERPIHPHLKFWGADVSGNNIRISLKTSDELLGKVSQVFSWRGKDLSFQVFNAQEESPTLILQGTVDFLCCTFSTSPYMDVQFKLAKPKGEVLVDKFLLTNSLQPEENDFGMAVPGEMDCTLKAVLLAFLLDIFITYYEGNQITVEGRIFCTGKSIGSAVYAGRGLTQWNWLFMFMMLSTIFLSFIILAVFVFAIGLSS